MRMKFQSLLLLIFICQAGLAHSAEGLKGLFMPTPDNYYTSITFQMDNDAFVFSSTDRLYSSGVFINSKHHEIPENKGIHSLYNIEYKLGQKIFTPDIVSDSSINLDVSSYERPYAGWLFFSITQEKLTRDRSTLRLGYTLGLTGKWSLAEGFQDWIHDMTDSSDEGNWDTQVDNNIGFIFTPEYKKDVLYSKESSHIDYLVSPYVKGNIGNIFIDAALGVEVKFGKFYNAFQKPQTSEPLKMFFLEEWYIKAGMEYKHVFYNYLLEGDLMKDNSDLSVDPANGFTHATLGLYLKWKKFAISYSIVWQSSEVDHSYDFDDHTYGTFLFSYFFNCR